MSALTLDHLKDLAASAPLQSHPVPVYEFGAGRVAYIAELSADERDSRIERPWQDHKDRTGSDSMEHFRALAVAACWCAGQDRQFVAKDAAAIAVAAEQLGKANGKAVSRMFELADKLNGFTAAAMEDIGKNSPPAESGSGTSHSMPASAAPVSGDKG